MHCTVKSTLARRITHEQLLVNIEMVTQFCCETWLPYSNLCEQSLTRRVHVAGTSWKYRFLSSGKSVLGHCSQVPCLGFHVAPSAGPHLRQSLLLCSRPVCLKTTDFRKSVTWCVLHVNNWITWHVTRQVGAVYWSCTASRLCSTLGPSSTIDPP